MRLARLCLLYWGMAGRDLFALPEESSIMQHARRLPPLLRALFLLGLLFALASLAVATWTWAMYREHQGLAATPW